MIKRGIRKVATTNVFAEEPERKEEQHRGNSRVKTTYKTVAQANAEENGEVPQEEKKPKKAVGTYVKVIDDTELWLTDEVKLVFSVAQSSQNSPAHVDIRTYVENENYTGPTKKGINFDIEFIDEVIRMLQKMSEDCQKTGV